MNFFSALNGRAYYAEGRAVSAGGECSSVTVGQHSAASRHQCRPMTSHCFVDGNIFGVHALRFLDQCLLDLLRWANPQEFEFLLHAADRPEKIHRGWPGLADHITYLVELA